LFVGVWDFEVVRHGYERGLIAKNSILKRIKLAEAGDFGDCVPIGDGVSEMRLHAGPGYRIYFCQEGKYLYLLLIGNAKGTKIAQTRDVRRAKSIKRKHGL